MRTRSSGMRRTINSWFILGKFLAITQITLLQMHRIRITLQDTVEDRPTHVNLSTRFRS